jgi:hypothetical protein
MNEISPADYELVIAAPVGPKRKTAGSHISDLSQQGAMIVLCEFCNPKFNPKKNHYEVWRRETYVRGLCDGCGQYTLHGAGFIHQSLHDISGEWENRPMSRRRGRWAK